MTPLEAPRLALESAGPRVIVNEHAIRVAPTIEELQPVVGTPSRAFSGERPAPPGHRNNVVHVYDQFGFTLNEHHYTRRIQEISCYFRVEERDFPFTPTTAFDGILEVDGIHVPTSGSCSAFLEHCPLALEPGLGGLWSWKRDGFSLHLVSRGPRLRSGRRGKTKLLVSLSIAWPHDPWTPDGALAPD